MDPLKFINSKVENIQPKKKIESAKGTTPEEAANALRNFFIKGRENAKKEAQAEKQTIQKNYTIKTKNGQELIGTLIKHQDGSLSFHTTADHCYKFKNENDLKKFKPVSYETLTEKTAYEYNSNDTVARKTSYLKFGKKTMTADTVYDDQGRIVEEKLFDKKSGKLHKHTTYENKDENNRIGTVRNANNEIETKIKEHYKNGKIDSKEIFDAKNNTLKVKYSYQDGKVSSMKEFYPTQELKIETIYNTQTAGIKSRTEYDKNGAVIRKNEIEETPDGKFDVSAQIGQGDCYLMSSINALRETEKGQETLKSLIKTSYDSNGKKVYTVTFPGAKIAADGLMTDPNIDKNKMYITGTYTFTEEDVEKLISLSGNRYSIGDSDVVLLEAAFEKYRKEVKKTQEANGIYESDAAGTKTGKDKNNILSGGIGYDATFILTGKPSQVYEIRTSNSLDLTDLRAGKATVVQPGSNMQAAAASEIDGPKVTSRTKLDTMLDRLMNDKEGRLVATCGFRVSKKGIIQGGHAFTIKKVTQNSVILINPWRPDEELIMSREDFINSADNLNIADLDSNKKPEEAQVKKIKKNKEYSGNNNNKLKPGIMKIDPHPSNENKETIRKNMNRILKFLSD